MIKKELLIVFGIIIAVFGIVGFYFSGFQAPVQESPEQAETDKPPIPQPLEKTQTKNETYSGYKYVTEKPTGWFETGQDADMVLYGTNFGESGGALTLNRPGKVKIIGKRLVVSDTWNNRVLIWNTIPESADDEPDIVLGQNDFESNYAGDGRSGMNWPMGIASDGKRLVIADTDNDRLLIWNEFPESNGEPADIVIGDNDFTVESIAPEERDPRTTLEWPWDVWTNGEKLVALSSSDGSVLIWNTFPVTNNEPADIVLGKENFKNRFGDSSESNWDESDPLAVLGTVAGIASDGKRLAIGSYHPQGIFVYEEFPTKSGEPADYFIPFEHWGCMGMDLVGERLFAVSHSRFFIWNSFPSENQSADVEFEPFRTSEKLRPAPDKRRLYPDQIAYAFGIASNGEQLAVADSHNDRVLIWNELPTEQEDADVVIGEPDRFVSRSSFINPLPYSDGKRLLVGSDGGGVYIYNHLPDEWGAEADVVLGRNVIPGLDLMVGGAVASDGRNLIMMYRGEKSRIVIWNDIPSQDNQPPDIIIGGEEKIGRRGMHEGADVETDGTSLFVSDKGNNRILVWNTMPTSDQPADYVLGQPDFQSSSRGSGRNELSSPGGLSTDGNKLAVADTENHRIIFWELPITKNQQEPTMIIKDMGEEGMSFNLPSDVEIYGNRLFVADPGSNRVLIWNSFPERNNTPPDIVIGQNDFLEKLPSNHKNGLFIPASISFDGSFLWVGETKWSSRLLRFSVHPTE